MGTVAVIGAGVFGAWTALRLAQEGHRVTLIDAFGPGNGRASSADHSRVIRAAYGADILYSRWAAEARDAWRWLAETSGQDLLTTTGALIMGVPGNAYVSASAEALAALGIAAELIDAATLGRRYPQIDTTGLGSTLFERDAGVLRARAAVRATVALACQRFGVTFALQHVMAPDESAASPAVRAEDGSMVIADVYVFACGAWLPKVFPVAVGARIRATRQEVLYFGIPRGDGRFAAGAMPVWIDFAAGVYGIPDVGGLGFKVGIDRHGPSVDPDSLDRVVDRDLVNRTRAWMGTRFPSLARAPLLDARVCQYENSSSGDFILDRHPAWDHVWIAGGGSGHGFKHGPAVARFLADAIAGRGQPEPRFQLAARTDRPERTVF